MATDRLDFAQTRRSSDEFISENPVGTSSLRQNRAVLAPPRKAKRPLERTYQSRKSLRLCLVGLRIG
jgi:hypothetical protein